MIMGINWKVLPQCFWVSGFCINVLNTWQASEAFSIKLLRVLFGYFTVCYIFTILHTLPGSLCTEANSLTKPLLQHVYSFLSDTHDATIFPLKWEKPFVKIALQLSICIVQVVLALSVRVVFSLIANCLHIAASTHASSHSPQAKCWCLNANRRFTVHSFKATSVTFHGSDTKTIWHQWGFVLLLDCFSQQ